jgi:hypothetical protein
MGVNVEWEVLRPPVRHLNCRTGPPTRIRAPTGQREPHWSMGDSGWPTGENVVPGGSDLTIHCPGHQGL